MIATQPEAATRWDLTAPESVVLRDGPGAKPGDVIKVAVLELVTIRVLRLVEVQARGWRGKPKTEVVIGVGSRSAPTDGPLAIVANIALDTKAQTFPDGTVGLGMQNFAMAFAAKHGGAAQLYIPRTVLPALEARGLFMKTRRKFLGLVPVTSWVRTPAGDRAAAQLAELTTTAERDAAEWSERDPRRLAMFLATAGGAALLIPAAYPVFDSFARRLQARTDDGGTAGIVPTTTGEDDDRAPDGHQPDVDDVGALDIHASGVDASGMDVSGIGMSGIDLSGFDFSGIDFDISGFAGMDAAFAGIDAGIGAAADGGGGDGGGGGGGD